MSRRSYCCAHHARVRAHTEGYGRSGGGPVLMIRAEGTPRRLDCGCRRDYCRRSVQPPPPGNRPISLITSILLSFIMIIIILLITCTTHYFPSPLCTTSGSRRRSLNASPSLRENEIYLTSTVQLYEFCKVFNISFSFFFFFFEIAYFRYISLCTDTNNMRKIRNWRNPMKT